MGRSEELQTVWGGQLRVVRTYVRLFRTDLDEIFRFHDEDVAKCLQGFKQLIQERVLRGETGTCTTECTAQGHYLNSNCKQYLTSFP